MTQKLQLVDEGKARIHAYLLPAKEQLAHGEEENLDKWEQKVVPTRGMPVFYNPAMVQNRNISVLAVHAWKEKVKGVISIADAMCGAGIRGIRYLLEAGPGNIHVDFVDLNPAATRTCKDNVALNNIEPALCDIHTQDSNAFLFGRGIEEESRFAVVDIDPFGNPMHYITSGLKALRYNRGLLHVNATDLAVLCGVHMKATLRKYQSKPLRNVHYHAEMAARVLAGAIFRKAMEIDCTIKPLITVARHHFVKIILEKISSINKANEDLEHNLGYILHCRECKDHAIIETKAMAITHACPSCNSPNIQLGGPLWIGKIQDGEFCTALRDNFKAFMYMQGKQELKKLLGECTDEAGMPPLSHDIHEICESLKLSPPSMDAILDQLKAQGWPVSRDSINPRAIKTAARRNDIARILVNLKRP
nr:hypothetical protein [Candidatus Sigynarchaeota archaeon]